jgi:methylated-DNA-protein-cysteine methyltransferase related protein
MFLIKSNVDMSKSIKNNKSKTNPLNIFEKIYITVEKIPAGKVSTYGDVAKYTGISNPKVVGYALHANKAPKKFPCHRVVNVRGEPAKGYAFGGLGIQKKLLESEGVNFENNKVNLSKYLYKFKK